MRSIRKISLDRWSSQATSREYVGESVDRGKGRLQGLRVPRMTQQGIRPGGGDWSEGDQHETSIYYLLLRALQLSTGYYQYSMVY